jgi:hypothetical protein
MDTDMKKDTKFKKGASGNPKGRPNGSRNKVTLAVEKLLDGQAETLTQKAVDMALSGDVTAMRLCMERIFPPRKDRPISANIGDVTVSGGFASAMAKLIATVANGTLLPSEGQALASLVELQRRAVETENLELRIQKLEEMKET